MSDRVPRAARREPFATAVDAALVAAVWSFALVAENTALGFLWREQFSGAWEIALSRHVVVPLAVAALAPASFLAALGFRLASTASEGAGPARRVLSALGGAFGLALAIGTSEGRHFASWTLRAPFVALGVIAGMGFAAFVVPRIAALSAHPTALGLFGSGVAVAAWLSDSYVLPRLYPAFHLALFVLALGGASLVAFAGRAGIFSPGLLAGAAALAMGVVLVRSAVLVPRAATELDRATNLRVVLVEHAPLLGRAVEMAMLLRPRAANPTQSVAATNEDPTEISRSLDWTGHDILLLTVDALRADHVTSYGYARRTTPNIDQIAREGTRFDAAYCPTPHTSYSVTSLMTGKYLRPLLGLGLGQDSQTWAEVLRDYGFRTAAFYPPAVFFIDQARFDPFERSHLGFEYAKVEFADPLLREEQVRSYLSASDPDRPLFLWVHFFEPHEPYVMHIDHPFAGGASADVDAYDSEIAAADEGIGRVIQAVRARRPGAVVVLTADHGEEFGEHGGRYHGTTVYEEQVRVPLVISGPGVMRGARLSTVVQTIDLLPTTLSALGIPRPARARGRDLGPLLAGEKIEGHAPGDSGGGFAFAETDDYALLASGAERLVCARRAAACSVYRPETDPLEHAPIDDEARTAQLRAMLRAVERDHGPYEARGLVQWPEALRRGLQGDVDSALDVAALLDDADVAIRRKAAEVSFALHAAPALPELRRAFDRDEDEDVRRWSALAWAREPETLSDPPYTAVVDALLRDPSPTWRRAAALALGEHGLARACDELAAWSAEVAPPLDGLGATSEGEPAQIALDLWHAEELWNGIARARCKGAVPSLLRSMSDVRARPAVADALGALGDDRARAPLLAWLSDEPYVTTRVHEAKALLAMGVRDWASDGMPPAVDATLLAPGPRARVIAWVSDANTALDVRADMAGEPLSVRPVASEGAVRTFDLGSVEYKPSRDARRRVHLAVRASGGGVAALWLVSRPPLRGQLD